MGRLRKFLIFLLALVVLVCGGLALRDYLKYRESEEEYQGLADRFITIPAEPEITERESAELKKPYPELEIDYDGLLATNPDFVGVLYMPVLDILYPVAASADDQEYLHRTFEGKNLFSGCIFLERDSARDFSGWNTWIFGHNMNNGSMFGSLKRFLREPELCDTDPYFYLYTKDTVRKYRIFSYHTTKLGGPLYRYVGTDEEYDEFLDDISAENVYSSGKSVSLSQRPRIVTLSTCYATGHVKSFVVHGAIAGEYHND